MRSCGACASCASPSADAVVLDSPGQNVAMARTGNEGTTTADLWARALRSWVALNEVLVRLLPLARGLVRIVRLVAWSGVVAAGLIVVGVLLADVPTTWWSILVVLFFAALLCVPGAILLLFHGALVEVLALPDWLRSSPEIVRDHGVELAGLVADAKGEGKRSRWRLARDVGSAGRLLLRTHQDLPGYGEMLRLVSVPFLIASVVSVVLIAAFWVLVPFFLVVGLAVRLFA
jgi:hypothetical protein